jgi:hypothetical protein
MKNIAPILMLAALILHPNPGEARRLYYAEEFYLYVMNLYQTNPSLERNIRFMQWALEAPFANQVQSLARIETVHDFRRYKALFRMHVNLLIIDSYLQLARRFDKEHVYFFNYWFAEELQESFTVARYYYEICFNYWEEARKYAGQASGVPARIDIEAWEDELYAIETGELDYASIISGHLEKLRQRTDQVEAYLAENEPAPEETGGEEAGTP